MKLTPELIEAIGEWDLARVYRGRESTDSFAEEPAADVYAVQWLRAWRRRGLALIFAG